MKHKEEKITPCHKPIALYKWILEQFSSPGERVIDTHVGGASSLIACSKAGCEYWGFEIDPTYYERAKERLEKETTPPQKEE